MKKAPVPISVIIPTLNEADVIGSTLGHLRTLDPTLELIVADGGSSDDTRDVARRAGAKVIEGARGRGSQLHAGALAATHEILWFVHADTLPGDDAPAQIEGALSDSAIAGGNLRPRFTGACTGTRIMNIVYPALVSMGVEFGDCTIFVRRELYQALRGFRDYPLFEDADLIRRLKQHGRFATLPSLAHTSSRRFEHRFIQTFVIWITLLLLYRLGIAPEWLARGYSIRR